MERVKLQKEQIDEFLKKGLESIVDGDVVDIQQYILSEGKVSYDVYFDVLYNGKKVQFLKIFSLDEVKKLVRVGMVLMGIDVVDVKEKVTKMGVSMLADVTTVTYEDGPRMMKRR